MKRPKRPKSERDARRTLKRLLKKWQKRLGLRDERLWIGFADAATDTDMRGNGAYAHVSDQDGAHVVYVNRRRTPRCWELDVVHELLHVVFASLEEGIAVLPEPGKTMADGAFHRGMHRMARALVGVKKQPWGNKSMRAKAPWER